MGLGSGTKLGAYEILSPLGNGGMGEVYLARDGKLDREVAIKVLPEVMARDKERVARFEREAKLLASLNHPSIAAIHGFDSSDGTRFLVMEYVEGETLASHLKNGSVAVEDALDIAKQIAEALEAAHGQGVIHRDLKPANVMIRADGTVKVLDFGLAKAMADGSDMSESDRANSPTITANFTRPGVVLGTAAYMSPEQARGRALDKRTDIWSFGIMLFECLTGGRLFQGETANDSMGAIMHKDPEWSLLPPSTPPTIQLLLRRCLTKDRKRRLQDIGDARIELENAIVDPTASSLGLASAALRHGAGSSPARRAATIILSLVLGGALTVTAMWLLRSVPPPAPTPVVRRYSLRIEDELTVRSSLWVPAFDVSADGNRVALAAATKDGERRLYIRDADQLEPRVLGGTDGAQIPVLSPDGEWIAFLQDRRLKKMSLRGGPSVALSDANAGAGLTWADDGHIVFSTNWGIGGTLMRVSENGGKAVSVFSDEQGKDNAASERFVRWPEALPGGDVILYVIESRQTDTREIHALVRSTGTRKTLLEDASFPRYAASGHLLFMRKGTLMAVPFDPESVELLGQPTPMVEGVTSHPSGAGQVAIAEDGTLILMLGGGTEGEDRFLVKVGMDGKTEALSTHRRMFGRPRIAPNGQRLATMIRAEGGSGFDVWILELARGVLTPLTTTSSADFPVWSPDGRWVYFRQREANEAGGPGIWRKRADGSGVAELVLESSDDRLRPCSMSRSGRLLFVERSGAVDEGGEANSDIAVIHLEDEGARVENLVATPADEVNPVVSPDGAWIAYMVFASGKPEIFVRPAMGGGARVQVSTSEGYLQEWSPDGKKLYFNQAQNRMVVDVLEDEAAKPGSGQAEPTQAERRFRVSMPRVLFERGATLGYMYDVFPDGEGFLNTSTRETEPGDAPNVANELIVTLNFFEELRRLAPPEGSRK